MKNLLLRCQNLVALILFAVGSLGIARAFGEPTRPMSAAELLIQMAVSLAVGTASFYALVRFNKFCKINSNNPK